MSRPELSPRQKAVFDALRDHVRRDGHMPILSDLARDLGITYVTLKQHLEALDRKGRLSFVSRGRGRPPLVQVTDGWGN